MATASSDQSPLTQVDDADGHEAEDLDAVDWDDETPLSPALWPEQESSVSSVQVVATPAADWQRARALHWPVQYQPKQRVPWKKLPQQPPPMPPKPQQPPLPIRLDSARRRDWTHSPLSSPPRSPLRSPSRSPPRSPVTPPKSPTPVSHPGSSSPALHASHEKRQTPSGLFAAAAAVRISKARVEPSPAPTMPATQPQLAATAAEPTHGTESGPSTECATAEPHLTLHAEAATEPAVAQSEESTSDWAHAPSLLAPLLQLLSLAGGANDARPVVAEAVVAAKKLPKQELGMRGRRGIAAAAAEMVSAMGQREERRRKLTAESAHVLAAEAFAETLVSAAEKAKAEYAKAVQEVTVPTEPVCEAEVPSMPMPIEANSTPDQQPLLSMKVTEHASGDAAKPKHADELMIEFARSMSTLARDGPMKRTGIREAGGIPPLVKLLFSKRCCSMAVEALSWLAMEKRAAHIIVDAGGIHRLTRLLLHRSGHVAEHAARALGNLAVHSQDHRDAIREAGGVPPLVSLLASGADSGAANNAAVALCNLLGEKDGVDVAATILAAPDMLAALRSPAASTAAHSQLAEQAKRDGGASGLDAFSPRATMHRPRSARASSASYGGFGSARSVVHQRRPRSARPTEGSGGVPGLPLALSSKREQGMESPASHVSTGATPRWAKPVGKTTPRSSAKLAPASSAFTPRYMTPRFSSRSWSSTPRMWSSTPRDARFFSAGSLGHTSASQGSLTSRTQRQPPDDAQLSRPSTFRSSAPGSARAMSPHPKYESPRPLPAGEFQPVTAVRNAFLQAEEERDMEPERETMSARQESRKTQRSSSSPHSSGGRTSASATSAASRGEANSPFPTTPTSTGFLGSHRRVSSSASMAYFDK